MDSDDVFLNLPMGENDAGAKTIGEYFRALLVTLWTEAEGFSGKRPFGNSSWQYDVYAALIRGGAIKGKFDADGYVDDIDTKAADKFIIGLLKGRF